jgi:hypothetical protein
MLKTLVREKTKTTVIARKLKRSVAAVYLQLAVAFDAERCQVDFVILAALGAAEGACDVCVRPVI